MEAGLRRKLREKMDKLVLTSRERAAQEGEHTWAAEGSGAVGGGGTAQLRGGVMAHSLCD